MAGTHLYKEVSLQWDFEGLAYLETHITLCCNSLQVQRLVRAAASSLNRERATVPHCTNIAQTFSIRTWQNLQFPNIALLQLELNGLKSYTCFPRPDYKIENCMLIITSLSCIHSPWLKEAYSFDERVWWTLSSGRALFLLLPHCNFPCCASLSVLASLLFWSNSFNILLRDIAELSERNYK